MRIEKPEGAPHTENVAGEGSWDSEMTEASIEETEKDDESRP